MTIRLVAKQASNLLPVLINREITVDQMDLVKKLLDATDLAEPAELEMLSFDLELAIQFKREAPVGGIEQYQAEDR